ncbi:uncharacterized protein LOC9642543 [Selaginella moellendorffii]|nr:uncharacterized protein LOC9642543 [Selaginella moellendorffii]|eukprot:XP_002971120.2 uncharacterized protein LOC9642543 [Selaginella moellendorffii]
MADLVSELMGCRMMRPFVLDEEVITRLKSWPRPVRNNGKVMYSRQEVGDDEMKSEERELLNMASMQESKKQKVDEGEGEEGGTDEEGMYVDDEGEEDEEPHKDWNILEFGEFVQAFWASSSPRILERKCYSLIWEAIEADFQRGKTRAIVVGNPGIGKSGFLVYVMWKLLHRGCKILLQNKAGERTLFQHGQGVRISEFDSRAVLSDKELYYLVDGRLPLPPLFLGKLILTCSPLLENYKEVKKDGRRTVFYMPVWKSDELAAADQEIFKLGISFWSERFKRWGGLARFVLEQCDEEADKSLTDAIDGSRNIIKVVEAQVSERDEASHKILHMMVRNDFRTYKYVFASKHVSEKVFRNLYQTHKSGLTSFLLFSGNPTLNSARANFLELLCREVLPKGGLFQTKCVYANGQGDPVQAERFDRLQAKESTQWQNAPWDFMFWPTKTTQRSWDAFRLRKGGGHVCLDLYQVTLSSAKHQHGIKAKGVLDLKAEVESVLNLKIPLENITVYIVTLIDLFENGGYQNWRGVQNHVLKDERLLRKLRSIVQKVMGVPV